MLEVRDLEVRFGPVRAVAGVSFELPDGPFGLGLVGESGSGKSTIGRAVLRLVPLAAGSIVFDGQDVARLPRRGLRGYRRAVQIVFQDPDGTLDPRMRVGSAVGEVLTTHRIVERRLVRSRVEQLLEEVGLEPGHAGRFPHEFSGGQRQRIAIARALLKNAPIRACSSSTSRRAPST